jgi:shikimate kinase
MATVVLLGCSTSGKSSAARRYAKTYGNEYEVIDTDALVSADTEFQGHLYAMYVKFAKGADTSAAQLYLELGERNLLKQLVQKEETTLIAAGPNMPLREPEWSLFIEQTKPICFYFRLSAEQFYEGLKERRRKQRRTGLDLCAGFGSWDAGLATCYNDNTGVWEELEKEKALPKIEKYLAKMDPIYSSHCEPQFIYDGMQVKTDRDLQMHLAKTFASCLRWQPVRSAAPKMAMR